MISKIWVSDAEEGWLVVGTGTLISCVRVRGPDARLVVTLPLTVKTEPGGMVVVSGEGEESVFGLALPGKMVLTGMLDVWESTKGVEAVLVVIKLLSRVALSPGWRVIFRTAVEYTMLAGSCA